MVYLITDRKNNKCKIGYSGAPEKRLLQLQTGNPFQLSLEKTIPGTIEEEFRIHKIFEFYRLEGEWFELFSLQNNVVLTLKYSFMPSDNSNHSPSNL